MCRLNVASGGHRDNDRDADNRRNLRHDVGQNSLQLRQHDLALADERHIDVVSIVEHFDVAVREEVEIVTQQARDFRLLLLLLCLLFRLSRRSVCLALFD